MLQKVGHGLAILGLIVVQVPLILVVALLLLLATGLGALLFFPPTVDMVRRFSTHTRAIARKWCGVAIDLPYHPRPLPSEPQADGWYRYGRTLFRKPGVPDWLVRMRWLAADPATWRDFAWLVLDLPVKLILALPLLVLPATTLRIYGRWAALLLAPTAASRLAGQVQRLSRVHNEIVDSQAAEMRRIERDLHDGTQARLVALGMTLSSAERLMDDRPDAARALMGRARDGSTEALAELRRIVRGISPPVLAERGLADAVRALAMDSPLRVRVDVALPAPLPAPVESALYFAICELLSNAVKHADPDNVLVDMDHPGQEWRVRVIDDGAGGADPTRGSGLAGIEHRLAAFHGVTSVHSPPGGPTTITMTVPDAVPAQVPGWSARLLPWQIATVAAAWLVGTIAMFPQGLVTAALKVSGVTDNSWFLPLHLSEPLQWPAILGMVCLGVLSYGLAVWLSLRHSRARLVAQGRTQPLPLVRC